MRRRRQNWARARYGRPRVAKRAVLDNDRRARVREQTLQPVLGNDSRPALLDKASDCVQHHRRAFRVQLRGGFVEHDQARSHGERRGKRNALALAAAQRPHAASGKVGDAGRMQRLFDPSGHLARRQRDVLESESDLAVDRVVDRLQLWVLKDEAHRSRQAPRRGGDDVVLLDLGGS